MIRPLRAAIVGAGLMGRWHAYYASQCGVKIAAIQDLNLTHVGTLAKRYGAAPFDNFSALLSSVQPDVVHLCTPLESHFSLAREALSCGAHVLVEKPLTHTLEQAESLYKTAREAGRLLCPVHQFAFQDSVPRVLSALKRIGPVVHVHANFCSAGGQGSNSPKNLDGIAADILPHPLSLFQKFVPDALPERDWKVISAGPGEWRVWKLCGATSLTALISMTARPTDCSMTILGGNGTIHMDLFHGYCFIEPGDVSRSHKILRPFALSFRRLWAASANGASRALSREPSYPGLRNLIRSFYDAAGGHAPPPITVSEALAVSRLQDNIKDAIVQRVQPT